MKPKKYNYQGRQMSIADIASETGQPASRIRMRLNRGWSMNDAVSKKKMPPAILGRVGKRRSYWAKKYKE